jgi:hypothetical protein
MVRAAIPSRHMDERGGRWAFDGHGGKWLLGAFIGAQAAIPLLLILVRMVTDHVVGYGWGWQMFSIR